MAREIKKVLQPYNLTHSQFVLLASIHKMELNRQEVTQIVLSAHTKIDPMTTSTVLKTLQKKELVKRQEHKTDTRAKTVALTEKGRSLTKQAVVTVEDFGREFFKIFGPQAKGFSSSLLALLRQG